MYCDYQVEDRPDEEKEDQKNEIPGEDNAIEMSNDFEGAFQDDAPMEEKEEKEDDEDKDDEVRINIYGITVSWSMS